MLGGKFDCPTISRFIETERRAKGHSRQRAQKSDSKTQRVYFLVAQGCRGSSGLDCEPFSLSLSLSACSLSGYPLELTVPTTCQAQHSLDNKMTIQNLLLVFCPSLCLSPPFLRTLIDSRTTLFETSPSISVDFIPRPSPHAPSLPPRPSQDSASTTSAPALESVLSLSSTRSASDPPRLDLPPELKDLPTFSPSNTRSVSTPASVDSLPQQVKLSPRRALIQPLPDKLPSPWTREDGVPPREDASSSPFAHTRGVIVGEPGLAISRNESRKQSLTTTASDHSSEISPISSSRSSRTPSLARVPGEGPTIDSLPPLGVVASRRNIFSTPIADRFKSNSNTSFASPPRHTDSTRPDQTSTTPVKSLVRQKGGSGGGGGFFSSSRASPVRTGPSETSSGGGGGRRQAWKRSTQFLGASSKVEGEVARSVADAIRALEGN